MKRVFTSQNSAEVGFLKSVLEDAGIDCFMRNESQAYQTLAFTPELWVSNDEDLGKAEELCKGWRPQAEPQLKRWRCEKCGEELEGQFGTCWKCAAGEEPVIADEPEAKPAEEQPFSLGPW
ncbi:MAG TPA: DUF2007 domain-containing protein, partial [Candidatus Binatia bacterium]|nr:DUF2007 domain-containing protein [Candidatus Binatia bacterium]